VRRRQDVVARGMPDFIADIVTADSHCRYQLIREAGAFRHRRLEPKFLGPKLSGPKPKNNFHGVPQRLRLPFEIRSCWAAHPDGATAMHSLRLSIAILALIVAAQAARAETIAPEEAIKHVGEDVTVCGVVAGAKYAAQVRGGLTFIDFGKPYPNATFTAMIFAENRAKFGTPEQGLAGKQVCVSGKIQLFKGKAELVLTDPKQLVVK
jgi:hypothetical protein